MKTPLQLLGFAVIGAIAASPQSVAQSAVGGGPITVLNPLSHIPITVDGQFTGGISGVPGPHGPASINPGTEWSDVTPLAFISPPTDSGPLLSVPLGTPGVNSLLFAAVAPGTTAESFELYLMYDYLPRTIQTFAPSEFIADIRFPLTLPGNKFNDSVVQFRGHNPALNPGGSSFFDVFVDLDGAGPISPSLAALPPASLDEAVVGFGPSPLSLVPHMLIELEVPLAIPPGFSDPSKGGAFPAAGTDPNTGRYSPDPAFWGDNSANDLVDPPASGAIFTINPDGSTLIIAAAPEPSAVLGVTAVFACGIGSQLWRRRREA